MGHVDVAQLLLADLAPEHVNCADNEGSTPLHNAVYGNRESQRLARARARVPLFIASAKSA